MTNDLTIVRQAAKRAIELDRQTHVVGVEVAALARLVLAMLEIDEIEVVHHMIGRVAKCAREIESAK